MIDPQNWEGEWKGTRRWNRVTDHDIQEVECLPDLNEHLQSTSSGVHVQVVERQTMKKVIARMAPRRSRSCASSAPALAHHSPGGVRSAEDGDARGTVKEFRWQNPHTWIEVIVPNEKGEEVLWAVELTSPTYLVRAGWKSNTLKPGDKVTVVGRPLKSGEPGSAIFTSVTLADGRTLLRASGAAGRRREK